jgi:hypothetical protein
VDVNDDDHRYLPVIFTDYERLGDVPAAIYDIRRRRERLLRTIPSRVGTRQLAITLYFTPIERPLHTRSIGAEVERCRAKWKRCVIKLATIVVWQAGDYIFTFAAVDYFSRP